MGWKSERRTLTMKTYIIICNFNDAQTLVDCAFKKAADAEAYAKELNGDKEKAVARCKELIALRDSEAMVKFLNEKGGITFEVLAVDLK